MNRDVFPPPLPAPGLQKPRRSFTGLVPLVLTLVVSILFDGKSLVAQQAGSARDFSQMRPEAVLDQYSMVPSSTFSLSELPYSPFRVFPEFFGEDTDDFSPVDGLVSTRAGSTGSAPMLLLRQLLNTFDVRQGEDDNFTIRAMDRSGTTIQVVELREQRAEYYRTGVADWDAIDRIRRQKTTELREKMEEDRGFRPDDFSVRWGRRNQVLEARRRDAPYIHYELRLARRLGLSPLATEIGTVETFNQDKLVSSAGARGRYQFMPAMLRRYGIKKYNLKTQSGETVTVREEWNPLFTLDASMTLIRAYSNAVGHEIPGMSAYHAGPGNMYKIFELYLENRSDRMPVKSVAEAYAWALTSGYPLVSSQTSFKTYSQGYIPSLVGSMRAVEDFPIDPSETLQCEQITLADGVVLSLRDLLQRIESLGGRSLNWGFGNRSGSLYDKFRQLNPQFDLPFALNDVPDAGNVVLSRLSDNHTVRFFLPIGSTNLLNSRFGGIIHERDVFRFDHTTYLDPERTGEKMPVDRDYDNLVANIGHYGFTAFNKSRLRELTSQLQAMSERNPTPYRTRQARIAKLHLDLWNTSGWSRLAEAVERAGVAPNPDYRGETPTGRRQSRFDF